MSKECPSCGKNIGLLTQKVNVANGQVCMDCWKKIGYTAKKDDLEKALRFTENDIVEILSGAKPNPVQLAADFNDSICNELRMSGAKPKSFKEQICNIAEALRFGETVLTAVDGLLNIGEAQGKLNTKLFNIKDKILGIMVVTNERILVAASGGNSIFKSIYLQDITAIDDARASKLISNNSVLRVQTNSTSVSIDLHTRQLAVIRPKIEDAIHNVRQKSERINAGFHSSNADELRNFKALLDDGVITEEEFLAKKKQLLNI